MKNRKAWLQKRKKGIGGSDVAAILGIDSFRTPVMVYEDKISTEIDDQENKPNDPKTALMYWGTVFEDDILDAYEEVTGYTVERNIGSWAHPDKPWLLASLDGVTVIDGEQVIVEAKNIEWDRNGEWGEPETDVISPRYMCQVQHYLNVTGLKKAHVAARISGILRVYKINRDDALIADIEEELRYFWFENVQKRVPPAPVNMGDIKIIYPSCKTGEVKAKPELLTKAAQIKSLTEAIQKLNDQKESMKTEIAGYIGEADTLVADDGTTVATFKSNKAGVRSLKFA
jgi:putative phage-type endonuclease